ncbi:MAG TPA: glycoside hydrolase family 130 protein [Tepidisphaeraceae bacterium]|nr:glycoside hydrolase family 130 protein [Tepidisphaeraceae bacterium]
MQPWELGPFSKHDDVNPILLPREDTTFRCPLQGKAVRWEEKDVFNPAAVVNGDKVCLLYRAEDTVGCFAGTSRIGLATSSDGLHFERHPEPVLYPDHDGFDHLEWEGGCEDPRVVESADGTYVMTYTAVGTDDLMHARLCIATSRDLLTWTKHGQAFGRAMGGRFKDLWSKAGSIVCQREANRLVAVRINGLYWMYWGESDIYLATSEDLINWTPVETTNEIYRTWAPNGRGESRKGPAYVLPVMMRRDHRYDSGLVEPGPPAVLTEHGIVFLHNASNGGPTADPALSLRSYSAGQALFDAQDPRCLLARNVRPFFSATMPYEITGQFGNTTFIEGLVYFNGRWLLYYGTADSRIAVASCPA